MLTDGGAVFGRQFAPKAPRRPDDANDNSYICDRQPMMQQAVLPLVSLHINIDTTVVDLLDILCNNSNYINITKYEKVLHLLIHIPPQQRP